MSSFGRQFDFHDVTYHMRPCHVDNDGVTSSLQLLDFQNVCKDTSFSPNNSYGKF